MSDHGFYSFEGTIVHVLDMDENYIAGTVVHADGSMEYKVDLEYYTEVWGFAPPAGQYEYCGEPIPRRRDTSPDYGDDHCSSPDYMYG